jgi:hypothetical protein
MSQTTENVAQSTGALVECRWHLHQASCQSLQHCNMAPDIPGCVTCCRQVAALSLFCACTSQLTQPGAELALWASTGGRVPRGVSWAPQFAVHAPIRRVSGSGSLYAITVDRKAARQALPQNALCMDPGGWCFA